MESSLASLKITGNKEEDAFAKRMMDVANSTYLAGVIGMAKELQLFETMATFNEPKSLEVIAKASKIKQRYLQEIFVVLVSSGIVQANGTSSEFFLPLAYRATLIAEGNTHVNLLWAATRMFKSYENVLECCKQDGPRGVQFEYATGFDYYLKTVGPLSADIAMKELAAGVPTWTDKLGAGIAVLEVGCGGGHHIASLARLFPNSKFTGMDLHLLPELASTGSPYADLSANLKFERADIFDPPSSWFASLDWVFMVDVFHDLPFPLKALGAVKKILKPGGMLSILELGISSRVGDHMKNPDTAMLFTVSLFRCLPMGLLFEGSEAEGVGLGNERIQELLKSAGFARIGVASMLGAPQHIHGFVAA